MVNRTEDFYFRSKGTSLVILPFTALLSSRLLFLFFHDPEGPNLLVTGGFALVIYLPSLFLYLLAPVKTRGIRRLVLAIGVQLFSAAALYCCLG